MLVVGMNKEQFQPTKFIGALIRCGLTYSVGILWSPKYQTLEISIVSDATQFNFLELRAKNNMIARHW